MRSDLSSPDEIEPLPAGSLFHGRYRVIRRLGQGAMGLVYEVRDERTNGARALKIMLPSLLWNDEARERFQREASMIGGVESEHVVRVSDAGMDGEISFVAMELLSGETLQSLLDRSGVLPKDDALGILMQIARALARTAAAGIIHRDIKPENVFITERDDGSRCVKVLDFGLAKVARGSRGAPTRVMGTPLYMSPEQVGGEGSISPRSDHYALAHVAYAMLAGEPYWREETERGSVAEFMLRIASGISEPPSVRARRRRQVTLPPAFDTWFARAAAVDPALRFASPIEQIEALAVALATFGSASRAALPPVVASPLAYAATQAQVPTSAPRSRGWAFGLLALAVVVSLGVGAVLLFGGDREKPARSRSSSKPSAFAAVATSPTSSPKPEPTVVAAPKPKCSAEICGRVVTTNLADVTDHELLRQTEAVAKGYDASAFLQALALSGRVVHNGHLDLSVPDARIAVRYGMHKRPTESIYLTVQGDSITGYVSGNHLPEPEVANQPRCGLGKAWAAAVSAGFPPEDPSQANYMGSNRGGRWYFGDGRSKGALVDEACVAMVN